MGNKDVGTLPFVVSDRLWLTAGGQIVDFLDSDKSRQDTPEERVRQEYGRKLHHDYGYDKSVIAFEAPISIGSETRYADIAIYENAEAKHRHDQGKIRVLIETKAPDVKKGQAQLKSYIFASSAEGGVWINTTDAPCYFRRVGRVLNEWPNIPREGEEWDGIGRHTKENLRPPHNLVETFKRCHNALYKVGIDSEDLAMDMVRIILAKYQDEMSDGDTCEFRVTPSELQTPDGRRQVAQRIRDLFRRVGEDNRDVFDEQERITAGDREIAIVVSELQDFRFLPDEASEELYDVVGAAYEVYVGSHLKGDRGQYFTHRLIVQLLVRLVDPGEKDTILDPAMGSGGFLIAAMRHVTRKIMRTNRPGRAKREAVKAFQARIFGVDKSPKLVKVARTNMILASDGHAGLVHGDSLEPAEKLGPRLLRRAGPEVPTIVLTNPPFGATYEHKITAEKEPGILEQFDIGHIWKRTPDGDLRPTSALSTEGVPPEYLFVERCLKWVKPGGRVGIVVPRGLLDNDKALSLRTFIFQESKVLAVVNCHNDTFKPYTGTKTALLVLERKESRNTRDENYPIFMAISQAIGHTSTGEPIYKTDEVGGIVIKDGEPVIDHDCEKIFLAWQSHNKDVPDAPYYFRITHSDIADSLNLNPVRYLPMYMESRRQVVEMGEREGWSTMTLGQIARIYNGPRFKRPYADKGVVAGSHIVRYFTGNAVTQTRGENIKHLDLAKAKPAQLRMIEKLYLKRGMILITDSGTIGRIVYATAYLDGAVGTNNLIRVEIEDEALRGYVYQFLSSPLGQNQLKRNVYGAIVDHIEPDDVKAVLVPIPMDRSVIETVGLPVIQGIRYQESAYTEIERSRQNLFTLIENEDAIDAKVAARRLSEIKLDATKLVKGNQLEIRLIELERS